MSTGHEVTLLECETGQYVSALLLEGVDVEYARAVDDRWVTFVATETAKAQAAGTPIGPQDHGHWRWERKVGATAHLLSFPTMAVECNGIPQGMMLLKTDGAVGRLPDQTGHPLVYVHFVATAPWNDTRVVEQPKYRGVGMVLMYAAVQTSVDLGFKGRLGLHSLPGAEKFYEKIGMTCMGPDEKSQNLKYFEMTAAVAAAFLE